MADACPLCGSSLPPDVTECPHCGARIEESAGPVDQLLMGLDDLTRTVDEELAQTADADAVTAHAAVGELGSAPRDVGQSVARWGSDFSDLKGFVERVRVAAATRDLAGRVTLPPRNPWAPPIIALGGLVAAWGVFELAADAYVGAVALLAGAATVGIGSALYRIRPSPQ